MIVDNVIVGALIIFVVRVLSIAVSTVRVLIMGRANPLLVSALAFLEALAFALTIGQVANNLSNIWNLTAYSGGFALGTWVGTLIEERFVKGYATINIVSMEKSDPIAAAIRKSGFGATQTHGEGAQGHVGLIRTVVNRRDVPRIVAAIEAVDANAFVTIEETRRISRGFIGYGRS